MTDKQLRHQKAQEFKSEIASVANRNRKIKELIQKVNQPSELEKLKITILLQKKEFISGCELSFKELLIQIKLFGDDKLKETAIAFASKNNIKL